MAQSVLVFFARRVYDGEVALDLTAETFARALVARRKFRGSERARGRPPGSGGSPATCSARSSSAGGSSTRAAPPRARAARGDLRRDRADRAAHGVDAASRTAVAEALRPSPPTQREALRLRVVDELDYPVVAARLGVSGPPRAPACPAACGASPPRWKRSRDMSRGLGPGTPHECDAARTPEEILAVVRTRPAARASCRGGGAGGGSSRSWRSCSPPAERRRRRRARCGRRRRAVGPRAAGWCARPDAASRPLYVASGRDWRLSVSAAASATARPWPLPDRSRGRRGLALRRARAGGRAGPVPPPTLFTLVAPAGPAVRRGAARDHARAGAAAGAASAPRRAERVPRARSRARGRAVYVARADERGPPAHRRRPRRRAAAHVRCDQETLPMTRRRRRWPPSPPRSRR